MYRYTIVGTIAFGFDFGTLFALTHFLGIHYLVSATLAFIVGLLINYILCVRWVFDKSSIKDKRVEFLLFGIIGLVGLGLNELFIWFFTEFVGFHYLASKVASTIFVYLWNFFVRRYSIFR